MNATAGDIVQLFHGQAGRLHDGIHRFSLVRHQVSSFRHAYRAFHHPSNEETGRFAVASRETKKITRGAGQAVFCGAECQLNGVAD